MTRFRLGLIRKGDGQSLLEAAFLLPFLLALTFNAINMGYFFWAYLNMATATRQGVEYSIQGTTSFLQDTLPSADVVSTLVYNGLTGAIPSSANTPQRVCTLANGVDPNGAGTSNQIPLCSNYGTGSGTYSTLQPDPEAPLLVLNRVDVQYTVTPPIPGFLANLIFPSSLTFHRYVYMRAEE
jgi:Flp pilus assembly protein TadG